MRPGFQCDPTARHSTEHFAQPIRIGPDSLLQSYLAGFVHHAVPTVAIPQIQTNCQFRLRKTLRLLCCCSANLLHCRSPLSLALQSASITWERTASRRRPAFSSHLVTAAIEIKRPGIGSVQTDGLSLGLSQARSRKPRKNQSDARQLQKG